MNPYSGLRIDEIAQAKKEEDFLEIINEEMPKGMGFESIEEVLNDHDCDTRFGDGCDTCSELVKWGFIPDYE